MLFFKLGYSISFSFLMYKVFKCIIKKKRKLRSQGHKINDYFQSLCKIKITLKLNPKSSGMKLLDILAAINLCSKYKMSLP